MKQWQHHPHFFITSVFVAAAFAASISAVLQVENEMSAAVHHPLSRNLTAHDRMSLNVVPGTRLRRVFTYVPFTCLMW